MVGAWGDWWMGHDGRWRRGSPPPGWQRARDGTWHPAHRMPGGSEGAINLSGGLYGTPTAEMQHQAYQAADTSYGTRSFPPVPGRGEEGDDPDAPDAPNTRTWLARLSSWPVPARVAAPAAAALVGLLALAAVLILSETFRDGDNAPASAFGRLGPSVSTPLAPATSDDTTTSTSSSTTTTTQTTTTPPTTDSLPAPPPREPTPAPPDAGYRNCNQARAAGAAPLLPGDPGYDPALDSNGNGVACDGADAPHRGPP